MQISCFPHCGLVTCSRSSNTGGYSLSTALTGSIDIQSYIEAMISALPTKKKVKEVTPYQIISGSGEVYYLAPQQKRMIKIDRGAEIQVLPLDPDRRGRYHVIDLRGRYFMVPEDEILNVGFN